MSPVLQRALPFTLAGCVVGLMALAGCARDKIAREGRVSQMQADQYMRDAIRQSSEGIVLEPSQKGLDQIERTRLNEIAQELRRPAAICFLERAIQTMEPGEVDGEEVWVEVPEGQAKFRARISVDGNVMSTEVLESGFADEHMETCLSEVIAKQRFVESRDNFAYFIDIYYWVSLGFFAEAQTEDFAALMRRQQAEAGVRAKACLSGRVGPGAYTVSGLNLFDREGRTVVNRIDRGALPDEVSSCIATAFKQIRIYPEPEAFIRPAAPEVEFTVAQDGSVTMADERWLELIVLEEQAQREMRRRELLRQTGEGAGDPDEEIPDGFVDAELDGPEVTPGSVSVPPTPEPEAQPVEVQPRGDDAGSKPAPAPNEHGKPGTKIDLSPRRGR